MSFTLPRLLRKGFKYGLGVLFLLLMLSTILYAIQENLIFRPTTLDQDYAFNFEKPYEELFLHPKKDVRINALHFKTSKPKGVILYFHGNMGDNSRWGNYAEKLVDFGYDVFIYDYRTYGKSTGKLSERALYHDAQFVYNYLKKFYAESEIILYGRSLGTGIAAQLASKNLPKQLMLETPYYSLTDIAQHRFPILPIKFLMKYKIPSHRFLKKVTCPTYIIHGTDDGVVPFSSGKKLYQSIRRKNIDLRIIEGGRHNNLADYQEYNSWLKELL